MKTCHSCTHSFAVMDEQRHPVLLCWPAGDRQKERIATEVCEAWDDAEQDRAE